VQAYTIFLYQVHLTGIWILLSGIQRINLIYLYLYIKIFTVYTMLGMQGLENVVCINSSGMADWMIAGFPVER